MMPHRYCWAGAAQITPEGADGQLTKTLLFWAGAGSEQYVPAAVPTRRAPFPVKEEGGIAKPVGSTQFMPQVLLLLETRMQLLQMAVGAPGTLRAV